MNRWAIIGRPCGTSSRRPPARLPQRGGANVRLYSTEYSEEPRVAGNHFAGSKQLRPGCGCH